MFECKTYRMTRHGNMVEVQKTVLEVGQRVIGEYGMCFSERGVFWVYSEPDEYGRQILVEEGGAHRFSDWDSNHCDQPISQKFGIGTYWDDSEEWKDYRMPKDRLDRLYHECEVQKAWNYRCKMNEERADRERDERNLREWEAEWGKLLKPIAAKDTWGKEYRAQRKSNVMRVIKACMPDVKFSLTKYDYKYTYELEWTDGPTEKELRENIPLEMFVTSWGELRPDDYYDSHSIRNSFAAKYGDCDEGIRLVNHRTDIPEGADWYTRDHWQSGYEWKPRATAKKTTERKDYENPVGKGIAMLDTEDGFCLMGRKTYYIRKQIKELGGKWDKEQQAWCFTGNDNREEVMALIG